MPGVRNLHYRLLRARVYARTRARKEANYGSGTCGTAMARKAATKPLSEATKRTLEAKGHLDPTTGATRRARAFTCRCGAPVIRGIDADFGGRSRDCDPQPLSMAGEVAALMAGVPTLTLRWLAGRYHLDVRDSFHIAGSPAGTPGRDVLAEHRCGTVAAWQGAPSSIVYRPRAVLADTVDPPY